MMRLLRSAFVVGRRDFAATVLSKTFIFFLLGPLFPLLLGGLFGSIGARVATQTEQPTVAIALPGHDFAALAHARAQLAGSLGDNAVVAITPAAPDSDPKALLAQTIPPVRAVLVGNLAAPRLVGDVQHDGQIARQMKLMIATANTPQQPRGPELAITAVPATSGSLAKNRALTAQLGQMLLFFLTILLSGMVLSQLIEEKSNKIIEVIAAAVPIDALFLGKLFAMLAASVIGIIVWVAAGAFAIDQFKPGGVQTLAVPAVGWPAFLTLGIIYFAMNYLLLGAVFLTIGAQASTAREVQTLSMPVTFAQVLIFGFAATAIGAPHSSEAFAAALFPLSSPMAMLARAAELPEVWPHAAAIMWQALWVSLILKLGARMFRRTVLKSGPRAKRWWRLRRA
jgi:ABC-2 type transport system permease protein